MISFYSNLINNTSKAISNSSVKIKQAVQNQIERYINSKALIKSNMTPHDIIYEDGLLSVLHYRSLKEKEIKIQNKSIKVSEHKYKTPLVCIPPLLAPGFAFDLYPERSLVKFFLAKGFDVYLIDFGSPDKSHNHLTFEDYILKWIPTALKAIRQNSNKRKLSLFGYCMGGLFTLLYTCLLQDKNIKNIITVASPIDMHQMGAAGKLFSFFSKPAHKVAKWTNINLKNLDPKYLHLPGFLATIGFHLTNPIGVIKSHWDLLINLWDRDYIIGHDSLGNWINNLLDYPGATMQDIIIHMALGNTLARKGKMKIGKKDAILNNVTCSLLSFAGENDQIVRVKSAYKIIDAVSSTDKEFCVVPGGHVGIIIGQKACDHLWEICYQWLAKRS